MKDSWHVLERAGIGVTGTQSMREVRRDNAGGWVRAHPQRGLFGEDEEFGICSPAERVSCWPLCLHLRQMSSVDHDTSFRGAPRQLLLLMRRHKE